MPLLGIYALEIKVWCAEGMSVRRGVAKFIAHPNHGLSRRRVTQLGGSLGGRLDDKQDVAVHMLAFCCC